MNFELGVCARVTTFDETDFHGENFRRVGRGERLVWHDPLLLFARIDCFFFFFSRRTFRIDLGILIFNEKGHKEVLSIRFICIYTSL